jgi:hypothetical protein
MVVKLTNRYKILYGRHDAVRTTLRVAIGEEAAKATADLSRPH